MATNTENNTKKKNEYKSKWVDNNTYYYWHMPHTKEWLSPVAGTNNQVMRYDFSEDFGYPYVVTDSPATKKYPVRTVIERGDKNGVGRQIITVIDDKEQDSWHAPEGFVIDTDTTYIGNGHRINSSSPKSPKEDLEYKLLRDQYNGVKRSYLTQGYANGGKTPLLKRQGGKIVTIYK